MDRRSFLRAAGVAGVGALTALAGCGSGPTTDTPDRTPTETPTGTPPGQGPPPTEGTPESEPEPTPQERVPEFDEVVNGVDDLGMDPTGSEPIDDALDEALVDGTLLELPPGIYLATERHTLEHLHRWGLRGTGRSRSEVRIVPPEDAGLIFLNVRSGRDILVENLTFDVRPGHSQWLSNTFKVSDGLLLSNIEFAGFYASEDTGEPIEAGRRVTGPLHVHVTDPDGRGVIDGLVRRGPTHHADYPQGTSCVFVGPTETVGTVVIRNSHIENMSSHGIYASRTRGAVQIENTLFKNNNGANCRFSGPNSYVRNSEIVIDGSDIVPGTTGRVFNSLTGAMWFESGFRTQAGGLMENCTIRLKDVPPRIRGVEVDGSAGRTTVRDTTIEIVDSVVRPVDINRPGQAGARVRTEGSTPEDPRVDLRNVTVTGTAPGPGGGVDIVGRPGSVIENCRVNITGREVGLSVTDSEGFQVTGTEIHVSGESGNGVELVDAEQGGIADSYIRAPAFPLVVRASGTPQACPVHLTEGTRLESGNSLLAGSPFIGDASHVALRRRNGCLDLRGRLKGGGTVSLATVADSWEELPVPGPI